MKIVTYNIRYGLGRDGRYDLERIARTVDGADVIALQEVERNWERTGMTDQPDCLGKLLPNYHWVFNPAFDVDASTISDNGGPVINRRRQFGTMLLSKTPILSSRRFVFPKLAATAFNMDLGAIEGLIDTKAGPVRFYSLHLSHLRDREKILQLRSLLDIHRNWQLNGAAWSGGSNIATTDWSEGQQPLPATPHAILMGDFNTLPGSSPYRMLTGEAAWDFDSVTYGDEFIDSFTVGYQGSKDGAYTCWSDEPDRDPSKIRIDYCFIGASLSDCIRRAWVDTDAQGSDHFPYWVDLAI